jgi:hypothetical protein
MAELPTGRNTALGMLERRTKGTDILNGGSRSVFPITGLAVAGQFRDYIILSYLTDSVSEPFQWKHIKYTRPHCPGESNIKKVI